MQRLCPRCRNAVTFEDPGSLIYCSHCGAPQVRLSEELLDRIAEERAALESGESLATAPGEAPSTDVAAPDWRVALQCAGVAGLVGMLFALVSLAVPFVGALGFFWAVGAPATTLAIYHSRRPLARLSADFGSRLGLLAGLAVALGMSAVNSTSLVLLRYVFHRAGQIDGQFQALFAQAKASMLQQSGGPEAASFARVLDIPEFRAGILLASLAVTVLVYLAFAAALGAVAGALRARRPAA